MPQSHQQGFLLARPLQPSRPTPLAPGIHPIEVENGRSGSVLYVPARYRSGQPAPVLLLLHGAGGTGKGTLPAFRHQADSTGTLVLAPNSQALSWDIIHGGFGPDVAVIDAALKALFSRAVIDTEHLAVGGFSDGASYALSLGLANGGLFSHVLALSPGFMAAQRGQDSPRVFISHGTRDTVLPIDRCSRRLVSELEKAGYDLSYHEFEGGHAVPEEIAEQAFTWFLQDRVQWARAGSP